MTQNSEAEKDDVIRDRILGGVFGLLLGDACGVPVEFSSLEERKRDPVTDMREYGTHSQPAGYWSDDGALALAHVAAFVDSAGWEPEAHMMEFRAWYEKGRHSAGGRVFDIGTSTARAILRHFGGTPWFACGCRGVFDNGNGSLMRILPVALRMGRAERSVRCEVLAEASALTHAHRRSQIGCMVYGEIAVALLRGGNVFQALQSVQEILEETEGVPYQVLLVSERKGIPRSTGYVVDCLESALWCLDREPEFKAAVLRAVNLGGDTDTTAAVCGGLAGLRCGFSGLPEEWLQKLPRREAVFDLANEFSTLCIQQEPNQKEP